VFGSKVLALPAPLHGTAMASGPGPEMLRMLSSKSSTSSKIAE
jgi:hypothetical protein